ncbi:hypothetical protein D3C79_1017710 [compost metagenome]
MKVLLLPVLLVRTNVTVPASVTEAVISTPCGFWLNFAPTHALVLSIPGEFALIRNVALLAIV